MKAAAPALLLALALLPGETRAAPELAAVFGDHMVLQRERPIRLWGTARPGEALRLSGLGAGARTVADANGAWTLTLPPQRAGGPHRLRLQGERTLTLDDVWIGDVWLCAGQSNMEWPLAQAQDGAAEVARLDEPAIRHMRVPQAVALSPRMELARAAAWDVAAPGRAGAFTAVGTFFAQALHRELGVPIGLVNASWGGTQVESWIAADALATDPRFAARLRDRPTHVPDWAARRASQARAQVTAWQGPALPEDAGAQAWHQPEHDDTAWRTLQVPLVWERQGLAGFDGVLWLRRAIVLDAAQAQRPAALSLGPVDDCDETWLNGHRLGGRCGWDQPRHYAVPVGVLRPGRNVVAVRVTDTGGDGGLHGEAGAVHLQLGDDRIPLAGPWRARIEAPALPANPGPNDAPGVLQHAMVNPLNRLPMRGVLWYQGESNAERAAEYASSFRLLIEDWRRRRKDPSWPFYFVQLASYQPPGSQASQDQTWAELREAQAQALRLPRTGMAVAIDVGDANDIHPRNKQAVGERLARLVLRHEFGRKLVAQGPQWVGLRMSAGPGARRMALRFRPHAQGLAVRGGGVLQGFEIADAKGPFRPAQARIVGGHSVEVWSDDVTRPSAVRYAWRDDASQANLVNSAGLPAPPFRTDRRPLATASARYLLP